MLDSIFFFSFLFILANKQVFLIEKIFFWKKVTKNKKTKK